MSNSDMSAQSAASGGEHKFSWRWSLGDLAKVKKNGLKVFSCFSCGGGSSLGYKLAGFDVVGCCEIDPAMMEVYKANNHPRYSFLMDIRDFAKLEDLPEELYDLDVLDGSPPCSVFSMAGARDHGGWNREKVFREGQKKQRLDDLFFAFIDVAAKLQPKVVIAENVKGLITGKAKGYVNEIIKGFDAAGYKVQVFLFNAAKMGVPQSRERVFFIGQRKDLEPVKLSMTFNEPVIRFGEFRSESGEPINDDSIVGRMLKYISPADVKMTSVAERVMNKENTYFSTQISQDERVPHTLTSSGLYIRACDRMAYSKNDIIACQAFPQDYDFLDNSPQYVCGMSVPPVMMANIASEVYDQIFKGRSDGKDDAAAAGRHSAGKG